jgi:hypothetical protein
MLAERWNGKAWAIQHTPNPGSAEGSYLEGVSCTSAWACTAVGFYYNLSTGITVTLAERWNGTAWAIQHTPNPGGAENSYLEAVSCTSASACTAVGYYNPSTKAPQTLAERWNGTAWAIQPTPSPSGSYGQLYGVSCTSAAACTAVGSGASGALAERWNGTAWAVQPTPTPSGASNIKLYGVSCTSASACTAIGSYLVSSSGQVTLAERWNGTAWAIQPTPNPSGVYYNELVAVSCASASSCTAVGYDGPPRTDDYVSLAEHWNGTAWAIQPTPNPSGAQYNYLYAVSCPSASACTAAGSYEHPNTILGLTTAERWNGTAWAIQPSPNPSGAAGSELDGVSCPSASACTAVGSSVSSSSTVPLAERWNGTAWAIQPTPPPHPRGGAQSTLEAVSCTSASACTAVGYSFNYPGTNATTTLAERWNGTAWAVQPTPNPSGSDSQLYGVSCTSATACTAVGSGPSGVLAERWNGTAWALQPTPNPSGSSGGDLDGVSCTSAASCSAVGLSYTSFGDATLAERWNGTAWAIQPTPNPSSAQDSSLAGVSCTSASACTAAGTYYDPVTNTDLTLAEQWNGTAWALQPTPNPSGAVNSELDGVSCTSASACTAVGWGSYDNTSVGEETLAEQWNGTAWAIQPTPNPSSAAGSGLAGVSCTSASACTAVGDYSTFQSLASVTLAERYS